MGNDEDAEGEEVGFGAMDVLAESARRVSEAEAEADAEEKEGEDDKSGAAGPKYSCAYCLKTFSRPSSLRIHTYSRKFLSWTRWSWADEKIRVNAPLSARNRHADADSRSSRISSVMPKSTPSPLPASPGQRAV
jgi:hypothetical protein